MVRTNFGADFWTFRIFYRNYVKIVAPSSDENENFVAHLKELSILKKSKTASKSTHKPRLNACSNYAPLERTVLRTRSVTKKTHFRIYSRRAQYDLPQTLHGHRGRRDN